MNREITVVIPTHNRAHLLRGAIDSVLRSPLIERPDQVLVVDDNSSDETQCVADAAGVRYKKVSFGDPSSTRNAGLEDVDTPYVTFLDDDDEWLPGNMEPQLALLKAMPDAAFVYGRSQMTTMDGTPYLEPYPEPPMPRGDGLAQMIRRPPQLGVVLFRTDIIRAASAFDPRIRWGEDGDLLVRLASRHNVAGVDFVGAIFRQRGPTPYDYKMRAVSQRDYRRVRRKWKRLGIKVPLALRIETEKEIRGQWSYYYARDSRAAIARGECRVALACLGHAVKVSPVHALAPRSEAWRALRELLRALRPHRGTPHTA